MIYQYQHQGDTLYIVVTEFESLGALNTDEHFFMVDYQVPHWVDSQGSIWQGSYPHMTASLDDAIRDHVAREHYTLTTAEEKL